MITGCIQKSEYKSVLRAVLIQYEILIKKLTGEYVSKDIENVENYKASLQVYDSFADAKLQLELKFWGECYEELKVQGLRDSIFISHKDGIKELNEINFSKDDCGIRIKNYSIKTL